MGKDTCDFIAEELKLLSCGASARLINKIGNDIWWKRVSVGSVDPELREVGVLRGSDLQAVRTPCPRSLQVSIQKRLWGADSL
jgi:hypothetical protein